MIATVIVLFSLYLLFRFVDEGIGMFDGILRAMGFQTSSERKVLNSSGPDDIKDSKISWRGILIGFSVGIFFMLLMIGLSLLIND